MSDDNPATTLSVLWHRNLTACDLEASMTSEAVPDRTSRVPQFAFAETFAAQETQLAENPLLQRFRKSREASRRVDDAKHIPGLRPRKEPQ
jgi:hypothetical protein